MAITTYAELQTAVANWLDRTDLTSRIPEFITLAEAEFDRKVEHHKKRKRATATLDAQYLDLPDDWLAPVSIALLTSPPTRLDLVDADVLLDMRYHGDTSTGKPRYITTVGDTLEAFPTPGESYTIEMHYWARIPNLSASNTSNWLLEDYPDLYLYGALAAAEPFIMKDERLPLWQSRLEAAYRDMRVAYDRSFGSVSTRVKTFG